MSELISSAEAAAILPETSTQSLLRWAREGKIPSVRLPSGRRFFRREDIEKLLAPFQPSVSDSFGSFSDVPFPGMEECDA
ncbi:helix-turn-helix domain-containing protein [Arcanobacterium hippocoleae]|uniref:Helix-turn-helix domain-containing protein n=1 Tax=Arcanobacterium hippocoleae TaxID=149017 RepID=A0ABU1T1N0_9ACTO|nr:helix-turn-helix domain-containing protein [Arcanobacterium hippocoleae]MDR6939252.1 hypothetical protein [Arcanobacterium hippocoleae]